MGVVTTEEAPQHHLVWERCHTCHEPTMATSHFEQHGKGLWGFCERCYQKHIRHAGPIEHIYPEKETSK